jgi:hypothetical protein
LRFPNNNTEEAPKFPVMSLQDYLYLDIEANDCTSVIAQYCLDQIQPSTWLGRDSGMCLVKRTKPQPD